VINWEELRALCQDRLNKLNDSHNFHIWSASIDEERSWINEKQHQFINLNDLNSLSPANTSNDSLAIVKNLLKKHKAFETDLNVHKEGNFQQLMIKMMIISMKMIIYLKMRVKMRKMEIIVRILSIL
jgi:hypothetical protein